MSREDQAALVHDWPTTIEGHRVSLKNAMLIALQGGATVTGGIDQWRKAGRKVKKGGRSAQIFVPLGLRKRNQEPDGEPDGESPTGYGIANVFDISQTEDANAAIAKTENDTGLESLTAHVARDPNYKTTADVETPYYNANRESIEREMQLAETLF